MYPGQDKCYSFFIERAKDDKKEVAKKLLEESFARQDAGTFDKAYFEEMLPKYMGVIKPEATEEVKEAMEHFASRL